MPAPSLTAFQQRNLEVVCNIGADRLTAVADALDQRGFTLSRPAIEKLITDLIGDDDGTELATFVFGVVAGVRQDRSVPDATLSKLSRFVSSRPEGLLAYARWEECKPALARLLSSESVRLATKALDISYDFERIYMSGRFITSMRPVFSEGRDKIMGGAIVQTLRLAYFSGSGSETTLSLALDRADIMQLQKACEEALSKGADVARLADQEWKLQTIMSGEDISE